ncbi:MAG: sporulation protein [Candidatus Neomarinimicrobiota bacterium]|nr:MAG: sporulation protein [Candidatus Neomarinimicrobiota bacterium]
MKLAELIKSSLAELQDLMVSKTVVGEPVQAGEHTVIPVSHVLFGFGSGGGGHMEPESEGMEGQGIGGGWSIKPIGFVVVGPDGAKLLTIGEQESAVTKLIDLAPKVVETVKDFVDARTSGDKEKPPSPNDQTEQR